MSFCKNKVKRKKLKNFLNKISIKIKKLNFSDYTILIGIILIIFSSLIPWFTLPYNWIISQWFFSKLNWITWYVSIFLIFLNIFTLFSIQKKEKIKLFFNIKLKDKYIFSFSAIIFLILWINSIFTIKWLLILNSEIKIHSGIIFYIIASILFSIWVFFKTRKKEKINIVSINESQKIKKKNPKKENIMELPFE